MDLPPLTPMRNILLFFLLFFASCNADQSQGSATIASGANKVIRIADGDTFTILHADKRQEKIRLFGINAPEKGTDFGEVAKQALSNLVFGKEVRIENKGQDKYGRTLAIVYTLDGRCVNEVLLKSGMAWHFKRYNNDPSWAAMERTAKANRLGVWSKNKKDVLAE